MSFGTVSFQVAGEDVRAILEDDRTWDVQCENKTIRDIVKTVLDEIAGRRYGPEDGNYGRSVLMRVALGFRGKMEETGIKESSINVVY